MDDEELEFNKGILAYKKVPFKKLLSRTWAYIRGDLKFFFTALFFMAISVALEILSPLIVEQITKELNVKLPSMQFIILLVSAHLGMQVLSLAFLYLQSMILQKSGQRIIYKMRMEVYSHIISMSQNQFNEIPVGSLVTRVCNYTTSMSDFFTNTIVNLLKNFIMCIGVFIIMVIKCAPLAGFISIFIVFIFGITFFFTGQFRKLYKKERSYISDLNTFMNENLDGMKITQLFNQQQRKVDEFQEKNMKYTKTRFKTVVLFAFYRPLIGGLHTIAAAVIFYVALQLKLSSDLVIVFYLYISRFFNPVQNMADMITTIQGALSSSEKLINLLDVKPEVIDEPDAIDVKKFEGKIEFKNVWFAYKDEDWILKDVSFVIEPMQTVAFVGATGAGKTTILSLIVRNFEIQKGQILIDDINIKHIKIESLRSAIGQMLQDVFLFNDSLRNNITLHNEELSDEFVMETCKYVNADTIVKKCKDGLDETVIERGENFSQGQKQLISFARTVIHKPQILILDEATANIDTETEVVIQQSLENIKNIGTMLVVAHRLSTIQNADNIIVLQRGEIIEQGNHQALLKNKGYYYKLYELQFKLGADSVYGK